MVFIKLSHTSNSDLDSGVSCRQRTILSVNDLAPTLAPTPAQTSPLTSPPSPLRQQPQRRQPQQKRDHHALRHNRLMPKLRLNIQQLSPPSPPREPLIRIGHTRLNHRIRKTINKTLRRTRSI